MLTFVSKPVPPEASAEEVIMTVPDMHMSGVPASQKVRNESFRLTFVSKITTIIIINRLILTQSEEEE